MMRLLGRDCCLILDHFEKNNGEGRAIEIIDYSHFTPSVPDVRTVTQETLSRENVRSCILLFTAGVTIRTVDAEFEYT